MQVSATVIAAQAAAREARARLQMPQPQSVPQGNFTAALEKTAGGAEGFSALPLKQVASAPSPAQPQGFAPSARLGQHVNIVV